MRDVVTVPFEADVSTFASTFTGPCELVVILTGGCAMPSSVWSIWTLAVDVPFVVDPPEPTTLPPEFAEAETLLVTLAVSANVGGADPARRITADAMMMAALRNFMALCMHGGS